MRLALLAGMALGALAWAGAPGCATVETGARDWRKDQRGAELKAARRARRGAAMRLSAAEAEGAPAAELAYLRGLVADESKRRQRRSAVALTARHERAGRSSSCCAGADDWRANRAVYDRWTAPDPMSFQAFKDACMAESREFAASGDYSKPASRRCVLGKMHQAKLRQWQECRQACSGGDDSAEWWIWDAGGGRTAVGRHGAPTFYLRPLTLGWWAVETRRGSGFAELDRFGSYDEALADAQLRIAGDDDIPF